MGVADRPALGQQPFDRGVDRAEGRAPAEDQQVADVRAEDLHGGDVVRDPAIFSARSICIRWWFSGS